MELSESHYWGNLGYWNRTRHYPEAARALALKVGHGAKLTEGASLLDLGSGYGAQLPLWAQAFKVGSIATFEPDLEAQRSAQVYATHNETPVSWLPESSLPAESVDAILSVDAAYHFQDRPRLLTQLAAALKPAGHLAWTDLLLDGEPAARPHPIQRISSVFDIPSENLLTEEGYRAMLESTGFTDIQIENLSREVLGGFAQNWKDVLRQHQKRNDASWLKYRLTATAARLALKYGTPQYVLVTATKA